MELPTTTQHTEEREDGLRDKYADWPEKGGSDLAQPWDYSGAGYDPADVGPGEPDDVSPVPIEHSHPILTHGSSGTPVLELCQLLAKIGYADTTVVKGENPFNHYDPTVAGAVARFCADYGVEEDPTPFGGDHAAGRKLAGEHVGPYTWQALERVAARED